MWWRFSGISTTISGRSIPGTPPPRLNRTRRTSLPSARRKSGPSPAAYHYRESDGRKIGTHIGAQYYTIGQRKGLNIGGHREPIFILDTSIVTNTIYVGEGHEHPGLMRKALKINADEVHWIRRDLRMAPGEVRRYLVRVRYRQPLQQAAMHCLDDGMYIVFDEPQRGITPGQFAVWYAPGDLEMLGSGVISE